MPLFKLEIMKQNKNKVKTNTFLRFSEKAAEIAGHPLAFALAVLSVIVWLVLGFVYKFSDTWQLVINSITNIFEFLILFLIQNTQNRDTRYFNIKLDELIRTSKPARKSVIDLEKLSDNDLKKLEEKYNQLVAKD